MFLENYVFDTYLGLSMLCILTHAFEDDWHQKVTKLSEHLKMHGSSICFGQLKELVTPHQQFGARICTGLPPDKQL